MERAAIVLLCLLQGCAYTGSKTAVVGCQAFDTWTTVRALKLGAKELNPIVGSKPAHVVATKTLITGVLLHLHEDAGPKVMTAVNILTCGVAIHNLKVIKEQKEINAQRQSSGIMMGINF